MYGFNKNISATNVRLKLPKFQLVPLDFKSMALRIKGITLT